MTDKASIDKLVDEGMSFPAIAKQLGEPLAQVYATWKGETAPVTISFQEPSSERDMAIIAAYVEDELSAVQVGERIGVAPKTVFAALKRHNVPTRAPGQRAGKQKTKVQAPPKVVDIAPVAPVTTTSITLSYVVKVEKTFQTDAELADYMEDFDWHNATEVQITR